MIKKLLKLLTVFTFVFTLFGCGNSNENMDEEIYLTLDAYFWHEEAMLELEDTNGEVLETGSIDFISKANTTLETLLEENDYTSFAVVCENDAFEGWLEYTVVITTDEDGFETYEYQLVSETLYSTEELLEKKLPDYSVIYTAKWAGMEIEDYYVEMASDSMYDGYTGVIALSANGGTISVKSDIEYEQQGIVFWMLEGTNTLNENFNDENNPFTIDVTYDGYTLTGWTVYACDALETVYGVEDGEEYYWFGEDEDGTIYVTLTNGTLIDDSMSSEDLYDLELEEGCYFAIANWE